MRDGFRVIDADCHQMESASMWRDHIDVSFRDRAPGLEDVDGRKVFQVEGESIVAEGKYPFSAPEFHAVMARAMMRFKRLREAGFGASARLEDMDEHGVDVQVLYPTTGGQLLGREFRDPKSAPLGPSLDPEHLGPRGKRETLSMEFLRKWGKRQSLFVRLQWLAVFVASVVRCGFPLAILNGP